MRKISKLSLVAAVAVAGITTVNAQPLEEAIKNVDVSGSVVYRYDNFHKKTVNNAERGKGDAGKNNYKIGLNLGSKVNDYVKFNSRFIVGSTDNGGFASLGTSRSGNDYGTTKGADKQADVSLSNAYFGFTAIPNTVVNVGKQGLTTPYTVATDINGNEQTGTGILALSNISVVTFGAGYFNNTNLDQSSEINSTKNLGLGGDYYKVTDTTNGRRFTPAGANGLVNGGSDIYVATVQGDLDFVKLEAWYLGAQKTFNSYTLAATSTIDLAENAKIGLEARYVHLALTNAGKNDIAYNINTAVNSTNPAPARNNWSELRGDNLEKDNDMFRLAVDGKFSIVNARLAYTMTGNHGGLTALDQDAKNSSLGWAISSNGVANADYLQAALGVDILDNLNLTAHYGQIKSKNDGLATQIKILTDNYEASEIYGQLTYKMSKNLSTYLRYGTYEEKTGVANTKITDQNRGRIQVAYTF
ncbi:major outer membrane protein [Aliarcobacter cryaerophilus]|uniref:major outer membrane protein n=1 Tax=Aliarcobacter cryaerophilus TaxID=28198 RepID=UPI003DA25D6A